MKLYLKPLQPWKMPIVYKSMRGKSQKGVEISREQLFKYCFLDTYGMIAIYQKLLSIVKEGDHLRQMESEN